MSGDVIVHAPGHRSAVPFVPAVLSAGAAVVIGTATGAWEQPAILIALLLAPLALLLLTTKLEWCLYAIVFMSYTNFSDVLIKYHGAPSITKLFVPLVALIIIYRWLRHFDRPVNATQASVVLFAFGLFSLSSLFYARDIAAVQFALSLYIKDALIAIVTVLLIKGGVTFRKVVWTLLAAGIFLGTLGAYKYLAGAYEDDFWGFARSTLKHIAGDARDYRFSGPIADPNYFASLLLFLVPLAFERMLHERAWLLRFLALWALVVCLMGIYFTASRGALVALGCIAVVSLLIFQRKRWYLILWLIPVSFLLAQFLPSEYLSRIQAMLALLPGFGGAATADRSITGRLDEWVVALSIFKDHPIFGVGLANYEAYSQEYILRLGLLPRGEDRQAHSLYLEVAAERGVVGLLVLFALMSYCARNIIRSYQRLIKRGETEIAGVVGAFGIALFAYLLCLLFLHDSYARFFWMVIAMGLALPNIIEHQGCGRLIHAKSSSK